MSRVVETLVVVACVVAIVAGAIYISSHVSCFDVFGLAKGCVTH